MDITPTSNIQQRAHNGLFFPLFIFGAIFGVVFYDLLGIDWTDEFLAFALVSLYSYEYLKGRISIIRPLIVIFVISLFYLFYSFKIGSNVPKAIISDYVVQIKPYLAFFCTLLIAPVLKAREKQIIRILCWVIFIYMVFVASGGMRDINFYFSHPSRFATTAVVTSFLYLYASNWSVESVMKGILLLSIGLASTRSKFIGFFVLMALYLIWRLFGNRFKINIKQLLIASIILSATLWFAWEKIDYYFIGGAFAHEEAFARPALYIGGAKILLDFFPFGSGFASFATNYSEVYYSDIYYLYGLNNIWGLSEEFSSFISDTYYPALAQFGVIGVLLFGYFWIYIFSKVKDVELNNLSMPLINIVYLGITFFIIESVADSTFTHNRGMFVLIIMALAISELRHREINQSISS
ncbi:MAG: hypothetical protein ACRC6R_09060 [Bacteroidales bacterium]